jgi:hypothetical protein
MSMRTQILFALLGTVLFLVSIVLLYLFLTSLQDNANVFLFVGFLICIGVAIFSSFKATRSEKSSEQPLTQTKLDETPSIVDKNNDMIKQYNQTAKAREELRMVELAGDANKNNA